LEESDSYLSACPSTHTPIRRSEVSEKTTTDFCVLGALIEYVIDGIIAPIAIETGAEDLAIEGKVNDELGEEKVSGWKHALTRGDVWGIANKHRTSAGFSGV